MLFEYHLWRCRRLSLRLGYHQSVVSTMAKHKAAKKLNRRKK
jgi:hypothetical protein